MSASVFILSQVQMGAVEEAALSHAVNDWCERVRGLGEGRISLKCLTFNTPGSHTHRLTLIFTHGLNPGGSEVWIVIRAPVVPSLINVCL